MKANELRIGNYINMDGETYVVCANLGGGLEIGASIDDSLVRYCPEEDMQPIPLTEQWLKDFGFTDDNKEERERYKFTSVNWLLRGNTPISDYFRIYQELDKGKWRAKDIRGIELGEYSVYANLYWTQSVKYVHELQNLYFCLTGKELEI